MRCAAVHTADERLGTVEAIAVAGGRVVFAGPSTAAQAWRGPQTRALDLPGCTVVPGFVDAHVHLSGVGFAEAEADLRGAASFEEAVARTIAFARTSPDEWIAGRGWDQNLWPGGRFPDHRALTAAFPDRPVVLHRIDAHALIANAAAMDRAGVANLPDPPGGRIVRDERGNPTGTFIDAAMAPFERAQPAPPPARIDRALRAAAAACARNGVTAAGEAHTHAADLAALERLAAARALDLRVFTMLADDEALLADAFAAGPRDAEHDGRLWIRAVKLFADGALGSRGAALLQPYADDPATEGLTCITPDHLADICDRALRAGFQVCTHAIGDRANRTALDAYERALSPLGPAAARSRRFRIEHAQVVADADVKRFAQLGIIASMQTGHLPSDIPWTPSRLGQARTHEAYAWRALLDAGTIVANGSDAPIEHLDSMRTFHAAVSDPTRRMTREEALRSMTIESAYANHQEQQTGSLTPGKYADFAILDRDIMRIPEDDIRKTRILATYFAGRCIYEL